MTNVTEPPKKNWPLIWAGIAIVVLWWFVVNYPEKLGQWTTDKTGPIILYWTSLSLFFTGMGAVVYVLSQIGAVIFKNKKKFSAEFKGVKLTIEDKDKSEDE